MKITRNDTGTAPVTPSVTPSPDAAASSEPARVAPRATRPAPGPMQAAAQQLRNLPEVDETFVSAMQEALKAGRLQVDTDALAQAMLDFYRS